MYPARRKASSPSVRGASRLPAITTRLPFIGTGARDWQACGVGPEWGQFEMPRSRAGSVAHYLRMACGLALLLAAMSTIWLGMLAGLWALIDA